MDSRQKTKIEKQIARGISLYMLKEGVKYALCAGFVFMVVRLLHVIGFFNGEPTEIGEIITITFGFFIVGCLSSFRSWDRLIEKHKEHAEQEGAYRNTT